MLAALFYRRPRLTVLFVGLWVVAGAIAFQVLPRQEDPTLPQVFGAGALPVSGRRCRQDREPGDRADRDQAARGRGGQDRHLAHPARRRALPGRAVRHGRRAPPGLGADPLDLSALETDLPQGASVPELEVATSAAYTRLIALTWSHDTPPRMPVLQRLAKELRLRLANLPGTQETKLFGDAEEEILVSVDPRRLAAARLSVASFAATIAAADPARPAGQLLDQRRAWPGRGGERARIARSGARDPADLR
jgi:multidrug efflux pump subunit AcrB